MEFSFKGSLYTHRCGYAMNYDISTHREKHFFYPFRVYFDTFNLCEVNWNNYLKSSHIQAMLRAFFTYCNIRYWDEWSPYRKIANKTLWLCLCENEDIIFTITHTPISYPLLVGFNLCRCCCCCCCWASIPLQIRFYRFRVVRILCNQPISILLGVFLLYV